MSWSETSVYRGDAFAENCEYGRTSKGICHDSPRLVSVRADRYACLLLAAVHSNHARLAADSSTTKGYSHEVPVTTHSRFIGGGLRCHSLRTIVYQGTLVKCAKQPSICHRQPATEDNDMPICGPQWRTTVWTGTRGGLCINCSFAEGEHAAVEACCPIDVHESIIPVGTRVIHHLRGPGTVVACNEADLICDVVLDEWPGYGYGILVNGRRAWISERRELRLLDPLIIGARVRTGYDNRTGTIIEIREHTYYVHLDDGFYAVQSPSGVRCGAYSRDSLTLLDEPAMIPGMPKPIKRYGPYKPVVRKLGG